MANGAVDQEDRFAVRRLRADHRTMEIRQNQSRGQDSGRKDEPHVHLQARPPSSGGSPLFLF
jgi:hypothetical protein